MYIFLDVIPEPTMAETVEIVDAAKSTPWILGYVAVGVLIVAAVLIIVKLIVKSNRKKQTK